MQRLMRIAGRWTAGLGGTLALLLAIGCGGDPAGSAFADNYGDIDASLDANGSLDSSYRPETSPPQHTLTSIYLTPMNQLLELDLNSAGEQSYTATGRYADGQTADISADVTWASSNSALGTFSGPSFHISPMTQAGATVTRITAELNGIKGEAQLTVVSYRKTGDKTDFFFVLPYQDEAGNQAKPLDFRTDIQSLDVFFSMDTTGSMIGEIRNLQSQLNSLIVPSIQQQIPDTQFGVGAFEDFPVDNYGAPHGSDCERGGLPDPDQPFLLFQTITGDVSAVQTAVNRYSTDSGPIGCGLDWPESNIEAMYQIATGEGLPGPGMTNVPANHDGIGGVAFRPGTMPVVIPITDAMSHGPGESGSCSGNSANYDGAVASVAHSRDATKAALNNICARVVGIAATPSVDQSCWGLFDEEDFARATGARVPPSIWDVPSRPANCAAGLCCTDINGAGRAPDGDGLCPLVFKVGTDGGGLSDSVVTGLKMLTRFGTFTVVTEKQGESSGTHGETLPADHTTADFIKAIAPKSFVKPPPPPDLPDPTIDAANGSFQNVTPGTGVTFDVTAFNDFVQATEQAQFFKATIKVMAGGCTDLDQREVLILVPPKPISGPR